MLPSTFFSCAEASSRAFISTEIVAASAIVFYRLCHLFPNHYLRWLHLTRVLIVLILCTCQQSELHDVADRRPVFLHHLTRQTSERFTDYADGNVAWLDSISEDMSSNFTESFFLSSVVSLPPVALTSHINSSDDRASKMSGRL